MHDLITTITCRLGVTETQARGGAALVLSAARDKLGAAAFDTSLGALPGMPALLAAAPKPKGLGRLFGGVASAVGSGRAAMIAQVVGGFGQLGMNTDQAQAFVPIIVEHVRARLDPAVAERVEQLIRA
ncbi:MAG: DUF2780 domain-containing protein [Proteobacteria bacterium]|nr:DUF2780 domain-containing protein [Pseudomonadota bacterium]